MNDPTTPFSPFKSTGAYSERRDNAVLAADTLALFIDTLGKTGMVTTAAKRVGISTTQANVWKNRSKRDPKNPEFQIPVNDGAADKDGRPTTRPFHEAWVDAIAASCDVVESSLVELATGYPEPVIHKGQFCYEVDTDAPAIRIDDESGLPIYPLRRDEITGRPIQLFVLKKDVRAQQAFLKARSGAYKERVEMDVTSGGKPLAVPDKIATTEEFMARFGRPLTDEERQALDKGNSK